jgi:hypothetical protein
MIVLLTISEKSWMFLTICICDSSIYNIKEELNILNYLFIFRNYQQNYHIYKSSKTFNSSQKLSTELLYTQIVKNIQLFSNIINRTIIYTNRQLLTISEKNWMFLTMCVYYSSIYSIREELNVLDNWGIW